MRTYALLMGLIFALIGVLGFVPAFLTPPDVSDPPLVLDGLHGNLFGFFPVNWVHNLVHLAFGIWGLVAYRGWAASRAYARSVAVIYALLMVMGLFPVLDTTFGLVPIHGNDVLLHMVIALSAAYFGFVAKEPAPAATTAASGTVHTYDRR